ncbi:hypothetical protein DL95DRAFT_90343 [Leptodontidium sp. 2 PMI_412]|nr:hypothetical protein DL95DRAFT_90343 [Leptodontidium sp. 2 PMI_412]
MDVQQDLSSRSQDEIVKSDKAIEDPICLFGQFVSAVTSDALKDIQPQSEASSVAQYLAQEIRKYSRDDSEPEVQGPEEHQLGINPKRPSRRRKRDLSYRLPNSSKARVDVCRDGSGW